MDSNNTKSNSKVIIIVLAILLLASLIFTFYKMQDHKKLTNAIEEEKSEIEMNLDNMIVKYEDAIADNTAMSDELVVERDKIIAFRDSVKVLKSTNYNLIRKYRKKVEALEKANLELFQINEELTQKNRQLSQNLDSVNVTVANQLAKNDTLMQQNLNLSEKVALGSVLKVNTASVFAMREKNNGKFVETKRSKNTDAFRISFNITSNEIAERGERSLYIQVVDPQGNVVNNIGELTLPNEALINYSDRTLVDYTNRDVTVISLVEVNREELKAGLYTVNIYIDNLFSSETGISLK